MIWTPAFGIVATGAALTVKKTAGTNDGVCYSDCSLSEATAVATATRFQFAPQVATINEELTELNFIAQ